MWTEPCLSVVVVECIWSCCHGLSFHLWLCDGPQKNQVRCSTRERMDFVAALVLILVRMSFFIFLTSLLSFSISLWFYWYLMIVLWSDDVIRDICTFSTRESWRQRRCKRINNHSSNLNSLSLLFLLIFTSWIDLNMCLKFVLFVIKLGWKKKEENEGSKGRNFDEILEKLSIEKEKYFWRFFVLGNIFLFGWFAL